MGGMTPSPVPNLGTSTKSTATSSFNPSSSHPAATMGPTRATSTPSFAPPTITRSVGIGAYNRPTDVKAVQTVVRDTGFYSGKIDGRFGPKTQSAIQTAQRHIGVASDGLVKPDGATQRAYEQQTASTLANDTTGHDNPLSSPASKPRTTRQQVAAINRRRTAEAEVEKQATRTTKRPEPANLLSEKLTGSRMERSATRKPANPHRPLPQLNDAQFSSNQRTIEHLRKVRGTGDLSTFTADAISTGGDQAVAEVTDIIQQVSTNNPEQAQELYQRTAAKLSPDKLKNLNDSLLTGSIGDISLAGGAGEDNLAESTTRAPLDRHPPEGTTNTAPAIPAWRERLNKLETLASDPYANKGKRTQAQDVFDSSIVSKGTDRIDSIVGDTPALFQVQSNAEASSEETWYELPALGSSAVEKHDDAIKQAAEKHDVDPDLIRAVMWAENARGHHGGLNDLADIVGGSKSIMPMNMNENTGARLTGGQPEDMNDPQANIDASAKFLKGITDRLSGPTDAAKIGTLWNSTGKEKTSDFGEYIGRLYREKPWKFR